MFFSCVQSQGEHVDAYVKRLRKLASCDFGALTNKLICDRLVIGLRDRDLNGRLATRAKRIIVAESVGNGQVKRSRSSS